MKQRYNNFDISKINNRNIFLDANIIIFLFFTTKPYQEWQKDYSGMFLQMLNQGNKLMIDFIVLSEVINRELRVQYELYLWQNKYSKKDVHFKDYRNSADGKEVLNHTYRIIQEKIFPLFQFDKKDFSQDDVSGFMTFEPLDFNDKAIEKLCREKSYILFTDDRDYAGSDIEIISTNPSLL
ncbi:MAG: hypothetical protein ACRCX4_08175 [Bacteroidales bacterium]